MTGRRPPGNLPAELSSFVGRRQELADLRRMVSESRLVTVSGTPGVGKTRLALRVAGLQRGVFHDGVFLVELDHVRDHALVAEAVTSSLGVPEHSGRGAEQALTTFLAGREMLLVLDNCEHVAETVTELVDTLLSAAPGLRVLATSREVLGVPGELTFHLEPLPVPDDDGAPGIAEVSPAVALFVERAAAAIPEFELMREDLPTVLEICRRLDGMPLALELAAAQLRVLSPAELAERLDDRFRVLTGRGGSAESRHRTLRAAVEWSYELCDKLERVMWRRLSVFVGDFDLDGAEAVCADGTVTRLDVVDAMQGLVNKSILSVRAGPGGTRFRLLDTLRCFGLDRLREGGSDDPAAGLGELELRARHLDWYAELAARFEREWFGPGQHDGLTRMRAELDDLRAALGFALEHPEHIRTGLRIVGALCWFWGTTAALREGHSWAVRLLDVGREPSRERSRALSALAVLMTSIGRPEGGVEVAREAMELATTEDPERMPRVLHNVGMMLLLYGDPGAVPSLERSVAVCRERGLRGEELAYSTFALAYGLGLTGHRESSDALFAESVELCQEAGDAWWQGVVRILAAFVAWADGDHERAETNAIEGLRVCRLVPDLHACAVGLNIVGFVRVGHADHQAAALMGTADTYWADAGGSILQAPVWAELVAKATSRCRANLGEDEFERAHRAGQEKSLEDAVAQTLGEQSPHPTLTQTRAEPFGLTRREREVAALVAEGLSNREIAERLVISQRTAETHVQNMLAKTGFSTRIQLAVWYRTQLAS